MLPEETDSRIQNIKQIISWPTTHASIVSRTNTTYDGRLKLGSERVKQRIKLNTKTFINNPLRVS